MGLKQKLLENGLYQEPTFSKEVHKELYDKYFQYLDDITKDSQSILDFMKFTGQIHKYSFEDALFIYGQNPSSTFIAEYETWGKIGRNVNKGSKALKTLTFHNGYLQVKNLFDLSQTVGKEVVFPNWHFTSDMLEKILDRVYDSSGKNALIGKNNSEKIKNVCEIYYEQLEKERDYGKLAIQSSQCILLNKLGIEVNDQDYLSQMEGLVDNIEITNVMNQVIQLNQSILSSISALKNEMDIEKENEYVAAESRLSEQRTTRKIRNDGSRTFETEKLPGVFSEAHRRSDNDLRPSNGERSMGASREIGEGATRKESSTRNGRYSSENKTSQSDQITSGRNSETTSNLQLNEQDKKSDDQNVLSDFFISEDEIVKVIQGGSGVQNSKFRIYAYFLQEHTVKEKVEFLKKEYGIGGNSSVLNDISEMHGAKGIELSRNGEIKKLSWTEVAKKIDTLVINKDYMSKKEILKIPEYEQMILATQIFNALARENDYLDPTYREDSIEIIYTDLQDAEKVQKLVNLLEPVYENLQENDRAFHVKKAAYENLLSFQMGDYSLFKNEIELKQQDDSLQLALFSDAQEQLEVNEQKDERWVSSFNEKFLADVLRYDGVMPMKKVEIEEYFKEHDSLEQRSKFLKSAYNKDYTLFDTSDGHRVGYHVEENGLYVWEGEFLTHTSGTLFTWGELQSEVSRLIETDMYVNDAVRPSISPVEPIMGDIEETEEVQYEKYDYSFPSDKEGFYGQINKEKIQDNMAAIRLLKELERSNRLATPEEQETLAKYVGWGGLFEVFDDRSDKYSQESMELKHLLSEEEYASARESVLTAYYTDPVIIEKMYETLGRMGFEGGKILDPAMGTGSFFSAMPGRMKSQSSLYGVELEPLTGKIAKHLQQSTNIQIKGFEETKFQNDSFDIVVGNVPFDSFRIKDAAYEKEYQIHDYFIKKSLDLVREGGIAAIITSTGTLDKVSREFRLELSKQAELLGAVRLPNNAFKKIAGTDVTTDILFFEKLPEGYNRQYSPQWVFSEIDSNHPTVHYNSYFIENGEQVLGNIRVKNFHGQTLTVNADSELPLYKLLDDRLQNIEGKYRAKDNGIEIVVEDDRETSSSLANELDLGQVKPYTFVVKDNEVYYADEKGLQKKELPVKTMERIIGMVKVREVVLDVIDYQQNIDYQEGTFKTKLHTLNVVYDDFVKKNGNLNDNANVRVFRDDDMSPLLLSIENKTKDEKYEKADIFYKATIRTANVVSEVDNAVEALNLSISRYMRVDMDYIQALYLKDKEQIKKELSDYIFINPEKYSEDDKEERYWETRDEYLTGNVKEKLKQAELLFLDNPGLFEKNVKELQAVIPEDLQPSEIDYKIGATWIPEKYYKQFIFEVFETPEYAQREYGIQLEYNRYTDLWFVKGKTYDRSVIVTSKYGTERANAYGIFEDCLNLKNTEVRDPEKYTDDNGEEKIRYVLNPKETMLAREKQEQIQEIFKSWLFNDFERSQDVLRIYNDRFNCIRPRTYDGSKLEFNGMNEQFELRPHQKDVVARILHKGRALMAHEVGAGKTASMISAGMMMKEQGMVQKPLYVVPNHLTQQFGQELLRFYPSKKVLITNKRDFEKQNRKKFVSRIATGDYDAVIIGHSQFEKIGLSKEYRTKILQKEIEGVKRYIEHEKFNKGESWSLKQMVRFEKMLKKQLTDLQNESKKDDILSFEQLGVDFLFVDESHIYKNLYTYTKMTNVAGVNTSHSLRASDMYMKCQYLLEKHNGRGVVLATGTPISNSMSEMYTMQRFLQSDVLRSLGIESFDSWASTFGEVTSSLEITPEGSGYRMKNRFAKFHNLPELMNTFNLVADIQTADMLKLPVPEIKGGKAEIIVTEATEYQMELMHQFIERAELIRAKEVPPEVDNMLKLTHEAKLMAIDPRLIDENAPGDSGSKLKICSEKVYDIWKNSIEQKSTQMIFSDSGTPRSDRFNAYDEIKRLLIKKGIPAAEIFFIHDATTDKKREDLFDKVRKGEVRILLGSTSKLGTGTNCQNKLLAIHHIDCPWRPSDLQQRDGRIVRQGNENKEVQIYRYVTKNSFDGYLWQIQENKLRYISQVMTGKSISRSCDDLDETVLNASEVKAVATGNPLLAEKMNLDIEVVKLRMMKSSWVNEQVKLKENVITNYPKKLEYFTIRKEHLESDKQTVFAYINKEFSILLDGKVYVEKNEAVKELERLALKSSVDYKKIEIGEYKGFHLSIVPSMMGGYTLGIKGKVYHEVNINLNRGTGSIQKLDNELERISNKILTVNEGIKDVQVQMKQAKGQLNVPFQHEEKLESMLKRQSEINLAIEMGTGTIEPVEQTEERIQEEKGANVVIPIPTRNHANNVKPKELER